MYANPLNRIFCMSYPYAYAIPFCTNVILYECLPVMYIFLYACVFLHVCVYVIFLFVCHSVSMSFSTHVCIILCTYICVCGFVSLCPCYAHLSVCMYCTHLTLSVRIRFCMQISLRIYRSVCIYLPLALGIYRQSVVQANVDGFKNKR